MYMNLKPNKHKIYNIFKHNNHDITGVHHGWNLHPPLPLLKDGGASWGYKVFCWKREINL